MSNDFASVPGMLRSATKYSPDSAQQLVPGPSGTSARMRTRAPSPGKPMQSPSSRSSNRPLSSSALSCGHVATSHVGPSGLHAVAKRLQWSVPHGNVSSPMLSGIRR